METVQLHKECGFPSGTYFTIDQEPLSEQFYIELRLKDHRVVSEYPNLFQSALEARKWIYKLMEDYEQGEKKHLKNKNPTNRF